MTTPKIKSRRRVHAAATSPARHLEAELLSLRTELRQTMRSYEARLEIQLAQSLLQASAPPEDLPREWLHQLRDLTAMVRKRKVRPEKGRRKDLRKIDSLITDLHSSLPNGTDR